MKINIDTNKIEKITYKVDDSLSINLSFNGDELSIEEIRHEAKLPFDAIKIRDKFNICLNHKLSQAEREDYIKAEQKALRTAKNETIQRLTKSN
jgi:hypothetical protein